MVRDAHDRERARWLRIARRAEGLSQRELADKADVSQVALSHIETGRSDPRLTTAQALAKALGYTVDEIFPMSGKRSSSSELRKLEKAQRRARKDRYTE